MSNLIPKTNLAAWASGIDINDVEGLVRLKRSLSNYVYLICDRQVPIEFWDGYPTGFTNGQRIVIGIPEGISVAALVGLVIHEALHIKLTDFSVLQDLKQTYNNFKTSRKKLPNYCQSYFKNIINIVEDCRIEAYLQEEIPNLYPYIEALNSYFVSVEDEGFLIKEEVYELNWPSMLILTHNIGYNRDEIDYDRLPFLREINREMMYVKTFSDFEIGMHSACNLFELLHKVIPKPKRSQRQIEKATVPNRLSARQQLIEHTPFGQTISQDIIQQISVIENLQQHGTDSDALKIDVFNIDPKYSIKFVDCIKSQDIPIFPFYDESLIDSRKQSLATGLQVGNKLTERLSVVEENHTLTYLRQKQGKIHGGSLWRADFGQTDVFKRTEKEAHFKPIRLRLLIDYSPSMIINGSQKHFLALQFQAAFVRAATSIQNIDLQIFMGVGHHLIRAYNSFRSNEAQFLSLAALIQSNGNGSPEHLHLARLNQPDLEKDMKNSFLLVVTDGDPNNCFDDNSDQIIIQETNTLKSLQSKGVRTKGYFIHDLNETPSRTIFDAIYGQDGLVLPANNLVLLAKSLNRWLLEQ